MEKTRRKSAPKIHSNIQIRKFGSFAAKIHTARIWLALRVPYFTSVGKPNMGGKPYHAVLGVGWETYYRARPPKPVWRAEKVGLVWSVPVPTKENDKA